MLLAKILTSVFSCQSDTVSFPNNFWRKSLLWLQSHLCTVTEHT